MTVKLGSEYRDEVSGFEGIAIGECRYITGSNRAQIQPKANGGTFYEAQWFDVERLQLIVADVDKAKQCH